MNVTIFRLASNAAYVIGSFAETELGAERVLSITKGRKSSFMIRVCLYVNKFFVVFTFLIEFKGFNNHVDF